MSKDKNNVVAIWVKGEALYNTCFFEHALILFHRGKSLAPDNEEFRLGIQKCHKTIGIKINFATTYLKLVVSSLYFTWFNFASNFVPIHTLQVPNQIMVQFC